MQGDTCYSGVNDAFNNVGLTDIQPRGALVIVTRFSERADTSIYRKTRIPLRMHLSPWRSYNADGSFCIPLRMPAYLVVRCKSEVAPSLQLKSAPRRALSPLHLSDFLAVERKEEHLVDSTSNSNPSGSRTRSFR